mgnify:CR=1 FL=1
MIGGFAPGVFITFIFSPVRMAGIIDQGALVNDFNLMLDRPIGQATNGTRHQKCFTGSQNIPAFVLIRNGTQGDGHDGAEEEGLERQLVHRPGGRNERNERLLFHSSALGWGIDGGCGEPTAPCQSSRANQEDGGDGSFPREALSIQPSAG